MDDLNIRERFTDHEWSIKESGKCSYQVSYGVVTPTSDVGRSGYCREPSWPDDELGYCRDHAFPGVADAVEFITGTCPFTVTYGVVNHGQGDYPLAILLADDASHIVRVNYDGSYETAYLSQEPIEHYEEASTGDLTDYEGFTPGWEC